MQPNAYFLPLQIHSGDEHYGVDRPVALVVRVGQMLHARMKRAIELMQAEDYPRIAITLGPEDVRWLATVGYTRENGLAPIPGPRPGEQWMPADSAIEEVDDVMNLDVDGKTADFRENCALYESASEPLRGETRIELYRWDEDGNIASGAPVHFAVCGATRTQHAETFVHRVRDVWPDMVPEEQDATVLMRQRARCTDRPAPGG